MIGKTQQLRLARYKTYFTSLQQPTNVELLVEFISLKNFTNESQQSQFLNRTIGFLEFPVILNIQNWCAGFETQMARSVFMI